jgi:hypothetical protein
VGGGGGGLGGGGGRRVQVARIAEKEGAHSILVAKRKKTLLQTLA